MGGTETLRQKTKVKRQKIEDIAGKREGDSSLTLGMTMIW
jgi:hypothetical protein